MPTLPPLFLRGQTIALRFAKIVAPRRKGLAPYYHFRILAGARDVGHINLRVGNNKHLRTVVGHVGYWIRRRDRGRRYALLACRALGPFARRLMPEVILTCDPDNAGSRLTIQRLVGGASGERVLVPRSDPHYRRGARTKLRFRWRP